MARLISIRPSRNAGTVPWSPGPFEIGENLDRQQNHFNNKDQVVIVRVNGSGAALKQNNDDDLDVNFNDGDFVLQTKAEHDTILMTFIPPVRAAAAQLAAFSLANTTPVPFTAVVQAKLTDGSATRVERQPATTTGARDGSAVSLGFQCDTGEAPMSSLAFSVEATGPAHALLGFGVNQVTYADQQIAQIGAAAPARKTRGARG